ncbi:surfeit locus protein 6-domain-containing protein [Lophiotrema nucula]|uniref:Surfeit locus protein 6-domain-containing protein n=1 Tax=Lophiotrema nucula TaxID=690887 RepID=A0A6A5ZAQ4_9PLEO|nr:surfeit locus protein 6-domain-containing protein [Lophiotrema nucula]
MGDDLEARLKSHARAFEGLMSIIPAQDYYGKDASITSNQWRAKKQTKEERRAAKRAKLDPASHKSAMDVMQENALKRKRELDEEQAAESSDIDMDIEKEKPKEGMKLPKKKTKKQKTGQEPAAESNTDEQPNAGGDDEPQPPQPKTKAEKRKTKQEKKKEKLVKKQEKQQQKKARQSEFDAALSNKPEKEPETEEDDAAEWEDEDETMHGSHDNDGIQRLDVSGLVDASNSTATPSPEDSSNSASSVVSAASSSTSIVPAEDTTEKKKEKKHKELDPKVHDAFRARLLAKLEVMRSARKADGPDGRPARNRAELIEARRKKEAERKAAKKANRKLAQEDEARIKAEAELAKLRGGSGSPALFPMRLPPEQEHNLAFGRVAWKDGQQLESNLGGFLENKKRKGASDPKTALEAAKKKKARISGLDEAKRNDIEEKDAWLNAKKRAQGERVHDDEALLKKTVKRSEKAKAKSKQEWKDRITGIEKGQEAKQKRREANLKKRREEKGNKGKKKQVKKPAKKVKRPGFEGTFKAR